ncbi:Peptidoglycan biosynthesis protein MviN/MurJ, putative lipid II flippase [Vogesella sp. LIG4]|nr:Peptidoglycan biosynthesis protein MviN/MurJ, putative lipid II flippase [Vogesella sp. LIG4]
MRNLIISWSIGFSNLSDLYFFIFGIATSVSSILSGALSATFIPYSQRLGSRNKRRLLGVIIIAFTIIYLAITIFACILMIAFSPNRSLQALSTHSMGVMIISGVILTFLFFQLIQIADEYFKSRRNFLFGALSYLTINGIAIIILYCYLNKNIWLIGWASIPPAAFICITIYSKLNLVLFNGKDNIAPYLRQTFPLIISGSMGMINVFIDRWFAAGFPEGRLSILQTALLLVTQLGGVPINPSINSAYPFISSLYKKNDMEKAIITIRTVEKRIISWLTIFTIGYVLLGEKIIRIFYHHGQVNLSNIHDIHRIGIVYLPVLWYSSLVSLYLRILYCNQIIRFPAICSAAVIIFNIALNWLFSEWLGWQGLALAAAVSAGVYYLCLAAFLRKINLYNASTLHVILINIPPILMFIPFIEKFNI